MVSVTKSVDVEAPLSTVYNQWTQFEDFPQFMGGVDQITAIDDRTLTGSPALAVSGASSTPRSPNSILTSGSRGRAPTARLTLG